MPVIDSTRPRASSRPPEATEPAVEVHWLGRVSYREAWAQQHALVAARAAGRIPDQLLLLEHPAVLTLGRHADPAFVLADAGELACLRGRQRDLGRDRADSALSGGTGGRP